MTATRIVLVHGNASSAATWRHVRERLATRPDLDVEAADLPGFGAAPPAPGRGPQQAVDEWARRRPCVLVGAGAGGVLALRAAVGAPACVRAVLVVGPAGLPGGHQRLARLGRTAAGGALIRTLGATLLRGRFLRDQLADPAGASAEVRRTLIDSLRAARGYPDLVRASAGGADGLERVACPVVVLWGGRSGVQPVGGADALRAALPPHAEVRIVAGAGHALALEHPDLVAETIVTLAGRALRSDPSAPA